MVTLTQLNEFVVFAKYLNISKAADVLFTSQSNLSKHLKQLESDLGFNLTYKKGNHIYLTDEGSHFLSGIQSVLSDYDQLVDECQLIKNDAFSKLTLQDPPFTDKACTAFYELVNSIRRASRTVRIDFAHEKFKDRIALLRNDEMHLLIEYHCADVEHVKSHYEQQGILAVQISNEPLVVWGKRFLLEGRESLDPLQLKDLSIMLSSDASSPMSTLISELPDVLGFAPKIFVSPARSAAPILLQRAQAQRVRPAAIVHKQRDIHVARRHVRRAPRRRRHPLPGHRAGQHEGKGLRAPGAAGARRRGGGLAGRPARAALPATPRASAATLVRCQPCSEPEAKRGAVSCRSRAGPAASLRRSYARPPGSGLSWAARTGVPLSIPPRPRRASPA